MKKEIGRDRIMEKLGAVDPVVLTEDGDLRIQVFSKTEVIVGHIYLVVAERLLIASMTR